MSKHAWAFYREKPSVKVDDGAFAPLLLCNKKEAK